MMASGKSAKRKRQSTSIVAKSKSSPVNWVTIGAVVVVLALVGVIFWVVAAKANSNKEASDAVAPYVPSATDQDPSTKISGIYANTAKYKSAIHVSSTQRVDYDRYPPVGGPHDGFWAACNGVVYPVAMRDENMVHTLEHGAVWIAYNPSTIANGDLDILKGLVQGKQFMVMSPYPTLTAHPISLQAWGHQLQVDSASDPRIKQFITALQRNPYVYPEVGATCDQPTFPTTDIPAALQFDPSPRDSSAVPLDGGTIAPATTEVNGAMASGSGAGSGSASGLGTGSGSSSGSGTGSGSSTASGSAGPTTPAAPATSAPPSTPAPSS